MSKRYEDEINFKPAKMKIITDESAHNLFENPIYHPIIQALRYKYLTISELEKEYNRIVEDEIAKHYTNPKERKEKLSSATRKG
ncbi:MAG: hypothetical protein ACXABK_06830 [Candidatus Heimdallarchaeaceae archaeon]|jgi:hypothetical protein